MPQTKEQQLANLARGRATMAAKRAAKKATKEQALAQAPTEPPDETPGAFSFQPAPEDAYEDEGIAQKIAGALGIKSEKGKDKKEPIPAGGGELSKEQREFARAITPAAAMLFIGLAGWVWSRIGPQYKSLAPSKEVGNKIIAPLCRIYARHSKISGEMSPDATDLLASLTALGAYVWTSILLYEEIKARTETEENDGESVIDAPQAPSDYKEHRPIHRERTDARGDAGNDAGGQFDLDTLSERDRANYLALNALRERDFASRARRSGQYGRI